MANWNPWHGCHKISAGCEPVSYTHLDVYKRQFVYMLQNMKLFLKLVLMERSMEIKKHHIAYLQMMYSLMNRIYLSLIHI